MTFYELQTYEYGSFSLSVKLKTNKKATDGGLLASTVPHGIPGNLIFWLELNDLGNLIDGAWCLGGDIS